MHSQIYEQLERIVDKMKGIEGIIGIILFGSYSRGDYDEGSDIDLLVVFKDKNSRGNGLEDIYRITAETDLFLQVISLTKDELVNSPLLESILREGKIYSATDEMKKLLTSTHESYALVTYSTANLKPKARVLFTQKLEGRRQGRYRYEGIVQRLGGYKVGKGVLMIPAENLTTLTQHLEKTRINFVVRYVWA